MPKKIVQMLSHGGEMYVATTTGEMFKRVPDPKDHNQGPHWQPIHLWQRVEGPPDDPAPPKARDLGAPQE